MTRDEDRNLVRHTGLVEFINCQSAQIFSVTLRLVGDGPVDRLPRLPQPWRTFYEQASHTLAVVTREATRKEPLDDLSQSMLGFLRREQRRAGSRFQCVQNGPRIAG